MLGRQRLGSYLMRADVSVVRVDKKRLWVRIPPDAGLFSRSSLLRVLKQVPHGGETQLNFLDYESLARQLVVRQE